MKKYDYSALFFVEETMFGPRMYRVIFDIAEKRDHPAVQSQYKSDSISGLAGLIKEELPNILAQTRSRKITVLPFPADKRIANLEGHTTVRPFDTEEQDYLKEKLEILSIKTRTRKI